MAMTASAAAALGFLLAVLWFDLMFDVQAWPYRRRPADTPEAVVASIGTYYRRVTTDARPMNRLVALAMLVGLVALIARIATDGSEWHEVAALVLAVCPIALAGVRIVPDAVRLGRGDDPLAERQRLARRILLGHVACWLLVVTALAFVIVGGR